MSWFSTFLTAVVTAVLGCLAVGGLGFLCVDWYRVSSREGASGYFIISFGLIGIVGGLVLGTICSRVVAASATPTLLRSLLVSAETLAGIMAVVTALCWLNADLIPTIGGKRLVVQLEVRLPAGHPRPVVEEGKDQSRLWHVTITADGGKRHQSMGLLDPTAVVESQGRWVVPAEVYLITSDPGKSLGVSAGSEETQYFRLPLPGRPTRADMEWSPWLTGPTDANLRPVPATDAVEVRTRVRLYVEPPPAPPAPPGPSQEEQQAREEAADKALFDALTPASPVGDWLAFTHYAKPADRRELAANAIAARPDVVQELSPLIRSTDVQTADLALRAVSLMKKPPAGLAPDVEAVGRDILLAIREFNETPVEKDPTYEKAAAISTRFAGWSGASIALHERGAIDQRPIFREILQLSRLRPDSHVMSLDVARVADFYVKEWGKDQRAP